MNEHGSQTVAHNDVALSPFGASLPEMLEAARCAEDSGFAGVWTYDHLTGTMLDRGHSQDAFVALGAIAAVTTRVRVGPLVANMMNRHPARLALAMASLQSVSSDRSVLGLGAGSAPGSRFSGEQAAVGISLLDGPGRRRRLRESIEVLRQTWAGQTQHGGEFFELNEPGLGLDLNSTPPIIIGASGARTVELALEHADGLNVVITPNMDDSALTKLLSLVKDSGRSDEFEVSIHVPIDLAHPQGGPLPDAANGMVNRRVLAFEAPFDLTAMARIGANLNG